jgi:hypothetical protein
MCIEMCDITGGDNPEILLYGSINMDLLNLICELDMYRVFKN